MTLLRALWPLAPAAATGERISLGQIEDRLRSLRGEAARAVDLRQPGTIAMAAGAVVSVVALTYLLGRRRGRRRATVLEIRRV